MDQTFQREMTGVNLFVTFAELQKRRFLPLEFFLWAFSLLHTFSVGVGCMYWEIPGDRYPLTGHVVSIRFYVKYPLFSIIIVFNQQCFEESSVFSYKVPWPLQSI